MRRLPLWLVVAALTVIALAAAVIVVTVIGVVEAVAALGGRRGYWTR